jgi:oligopeptide/dipeptide ABC transporter ATP-binding protein
MSRQDADALSVRILREVGISDAARRMSQYPHQLSGGMRQRVLVAMALLNGPRLLVADEPTTALDVTIQAQLIRLLAREADDRHMALLLVTHDLRLVAGLCDRVIVMYAGMVVEVGPASVIYGHPSHPYSAALLECANGLNRPRGTPLDPIAGSAPDPKALPPGCPFAPRCAHAFDRCVTERPVLRMVGKERWSACHLDS